MPWQATSEDGGCASRERPSWSFSARHHLPSAIRTATWRPCRRLAMPHIAVLFPRPASALTTSPLRPSGAPQPDAGKVWEGRLPPPAGPLPRLSPTPPSFLNSVNPAKVDRLAGVEHPEDAAARRTPVRKASFCHMDCRRSLGVAAPWCQFSLAHLDGRARRAPSSPSSCPLSRVAASCAVDMCSPYIEASAARSPVPPLSPICSSLLVS